MFTVFDSVNLYICVFMTCSTSCCLFYTLMDPWNVCVCIYYVGIYEGSYLSLGYLIPKVKTVQSLLNSGNNTA